MTVVPVHDIFAGQRCGVACLRAAHLQHERRARGPFLLIRDPTDNVKESWPRSSQSIARWHCCTLYTSWHCTFSAWVCHQHTDPIIIRGSKRVQSDLCLIARIACQALFQIITQQINLKFSRDEKRGCPREGRPDSPREMNVFEKFENPVADESNGSPTPRSVRRFSCICPLP